LDKKYNIIDLFSGCGGFSQGFLKTGFEIIAASELWAPAIETYIENHKNVQVIEGDIRSPKKKQELYDLISKNKINIIIGGPPCQGYSVAGNRDPEDPRGQLYLDFVEIVDHIKPDFFIMEDVKGLINMTHVDPNLDSKQITIFKNNCIKFKRYKDLKRYSAQRELNNEENKEFFQLKQDLKKIKKQIKINLVPLIDKFLNKFKEINYKVSWKLLNSADYGVPQVRERVIFIGTKYNDIKLKFPEKTHTKDLTQKSLSDFINTESNISLKKWITSKAALKKYENWRESIEKNHIFTKHSPEFIQKLKNTPIGKNVFEKYTDSFWRLDPNRPARTVKENHGGVFVHYNFNRVCTPRELATLQSFDDSFIFKGTKSAVLKQIGNAVPPLMAKAIAENVKMLLNDLYNKKG